ncbi:vitamin K epoxide reductase family protein [Tessaracoccus sp. OS52]|uniref:vitamin K epoxide reductase family protein n=1 Tax=Tessaracoccus sp. OS52 TaxID=2886691 RepID=UPI001D1251BB|nr:vitamin K epoxide reductase family protein [Tessaracoccus sp. OS52]MCC2592580.1 vitamin K epoxide reductase family protein [Tessaracoccus sp. OS52]
MTQSDTAVLEPEETDDGLLSAGQWRRARRFLFGEMLLFATLSLIASFVLSYDAIVLAADPGAELACSINPFLDCAKVALTWQASVFGFPNAFLGLISEPVVMTIAVASLSGVRFPRWFMFTANAVYLLGVIFAYWLLFQSTYEIGALCPWCILVTISTTFVFISMTHWNILENNLFLKPETHQKAVAFAKGGWITIILIGWLAFVVVLEVIRWAPAFL